MIARFMAPRSKFARFDAFTLMEVLVVVGLTAVVAGLFFPAFNSVREAARNAEAKEQMMQLLTAIRGYHTDYGRVPMLHQGEDRTFGEPRNKGAGDYDQAELMNVLRATGKGWDDPQATNLNSKRTVFFEPRLAKNPAQPAGGIGTDGRLYDPWGRPYLIKMDGNYDGVIDLDYTDVTDVTGSIVAISTGRDRTVGNKKKQHKKLKDADDVVLPYR